MAEPTASYTASVKALREGESFSRSIRIPLDDSAAKAVPKRLAALRNSVNQNVSRARESTGRGYRVDSGQFISYDGSAVLATVVVTCMEDEGEDDI